MIAILAFAQAPAAGPYSVLKTAKVGGDGGFDYVFADSTGRKLYVPRTGPTPRVTVFDLDSLKPAGEIAKTNATFKAVNDSMIAYRNAAYQWHSVAELGYDAFMINHTRS